METGKLFPIQTNGEKGRPRGESAPAFRAYCVYRDLGPGRSLIAAWNASCAKRASKSNPKQSIQEVQYCPGHWTHWSSEFDWERRAAAYDSQMDAAKCAARLERSCKLKDRREAFELENQESMEKNVRTMDERLDKYATTPVTDVTQVREETVDGKTIRSTTGLKAVKGSDHAALMKQRDQTARLAVVGFRNGEPTQARKVVGKISWIGESPKEGAA